MKFFSNHILALIIKELLTLFRDPKGRLVLIAPPLLQLLVFAFAATLEVKNITLVVLNQDGGKHSHEIIERILGAPSFTDIYFTQSPQEFKKAIDEQKAMAGLKFAQDFSRKVNTGEDVNIQMILDGRRSNAAQIVNGYINQIITNYVKELAHNKGAQKPLAIQERNWFNPNLLYTWFTVPSLVAILSMLIALVITSLSVARERELGTFDQLLVSPILPREILFGKTIPAVILGLSEGLLIWFMGITFFGIPFEGSFLLLVLSLLMFVFSIVGVGLFISSLSKTQQQAILGTFIFMVPAVTLSGYAAPIENMPQWLQFLTFFNPLKHELIIIKGLFLKDMSLKEILKHAWPFLIIGPATLSLAGWSFSKRMS